MMMLVIQRRLVLELVPPPVIVQHRHEPRPSWLKARAQGRSKTRLPMAILVLVMASIATSSGLITGYLIGKGEPALSCSPAPASKKTNSLSRMA